MKIIFATSNKHKVEEASAILKEYNIRIEHLNIRYNEARAEIVEEVVKESVSKLSNDLNLELIIEDTGIFFKAYNNFPGPYPKKVFEKLGYDGIFNLLKDKNKEAYFKTIVGYCKPGKEPLLFEGVFEGIIANEVFDTDKNVMPYERIFIPNGYSVSLSNITREEKNKISHRAKAFRKFGEYYTSKADFNDLNEVIYRLRRECPWDKEQTIGTLKEYLEREIREVKEAINTADYENLKEELGDLLVNILFISIIAEELCKFNISDVLGTSYAKMIRRHPHVFGELKLSTTEEAIIQWDKIKKEEKGG